MFRFIDFTLAFIGLCGTLPFTIFILFSLIITGSRPIFKQKRLGKDKIEFTLYKFRTMKLDTQNEATHLVSSSQITVLGHLLRKSKLDELPQLWNVLNGEMSLVGPRPCLINQHELIKERSKLGIFSVKPGITGLAQINKIDMSIPKYLAKKDAQMISTLSFSKYFYYIYMTILGKGRGDQVKY
jgi:O-antigen biosynthesis protein WbqP